MGVITGVVNGGVILTGPSADGTDGQVLTTDGNGNLAFEDAGGGVTDHGALTGLSDDDHPQYALVAGDTFTGPINFTGTSANDVRIQKVATQTLSIEHGDGGGYGDLKCHDVIVETNGLYGWDGVAYIDQSSGVIRHRVWAGTDADISAKAAVFSGSVSATDGSGSNAAGTNLVLQPGQSTGNATPAQVRIQGTTAGSSGSTLQTLADMVAVAAAAVTSGLSGVLSCFGLRVNSDATVAGNLSVDTNTLHVDASNNAVLVGSTTWLGRASFEITGGGGANIAFGSYRNVDYNGFEVGESTTKCVFIAWRNTLERGEIGTSSYLYPLVLGNEWLTLGTDASATFGGAIKPKSLADGSAPNNSIYYSTTASKLVYKDSGGSVNALY